LERNVSSSLHLWDIKFDSGINQTIALTKETEGREWRLQYLTEDGDKAVESPAVASENQPALRAREVGDYVLACSISFSSFTVGITRHSGSWPQD
jgi:hypothetical protein